MMGREKRPLIEDYEHTSPNTNRNRSRSRSPIHHHDDSPPSQSSQAYASPRLRRSRSPRREELYSRTESHSRRRSDSAERKLEYDENVETKKPAYGGPKNPLILDSNIQISVKSRSSSSPVRPSSLNRIVIVRHRGEEKPHNSNARDRGRYDRKFSRHDSKYDSPSPNRRKISPSRGRREICRRSHENRNRRNETYGNGRYDRHKRDRSRDDRRVDSSRDRRHENPRNNDGNSVHSSRRNVYDDKLKMERSSARRRYSKDDKQDVECSHSGRRKSHDTSENHHEEEPEGSKNGKKNEDNQNAPNFNDALVAMRIRPPVWHSMLSIRPPIFPSPRPVFTPIGYMFPPRPFLRFPRFPAIYYASRPIPPPSSTY